MVVVIWVVSVVLCGFLVHSAHGKIVGQEKQLAGMRAVGFPVERIGWLALAELSAVAGLLVGLFWWPAGVAAAGGLVAYFTGALVYLLRARLTRVAFWAPAAVFLVAALGLLVGGVVRG